MKRTYIDSGVLIAAARGSGRLFDRAMAILADPSREFVSSAYVRLETVPKAVFFNRTAEAEFYEEFFKYSAIWAVFDDATMEKCFEEASRSGLSAVDAIHVVLAAEAGCEELVTTEKPEKPIHRTQRVRTISIDID